MIRVVIVDDHAVVRAGLRQFLGDQVDLRVTGEAANGREALDLLRARICERLGWMGIEIDHGLNAENATVISSEFARTTVMIVPTREDLMIARAARVRFSGVIVVLPDDDVASAIDEIGKVRGTPVAVVARSALQTMLRRGLTGARDIGGNELFDIRTRLQQAVRFV